MSEPAYGWVSAGLRVATPLPAFTQERWGAAVTPSGTWVPTSGTLRNEDCVWVRNTLSHAFSLSISNVLLCSSYLSHFIFWSVHKPCLCIFKHGLFKSTVLTLPKWKFCHYLAILRTSVRLFSSVIYKKIWWEGWEQSNSKMTARSDI